MRRQEKNPAPTFLLQAMFKELNPLLHSELRLAVISLLLGVECTDFVYLREQTGATAGNLSVQLDKLEKAGYIAVEKGFVGKKTAHHLPNYPTGDRGVRGICANIERVSKVVQ